MKSKQEEIVKGGEGAEKDFRGFGKERNSGLWPRSREIKDEAQCFSKDHQSYGRHSQDPATTLR